MLRDWAADPIGGTFWQALSVGRFLFPRCQRCGIWQSYLRQVCPACRAVNSMRWNQPEDDQLTGTVYSVTTQHRSPVWFDVPPPFQVALVDLALGVRFLTCLLPPVYTRPGDRVRLVVRKREGGNLYAAVPEVGT